MLLLGRPRSGARHPRGRQRGYIRNYSPLRLSGVFAEHDLFDGCHDVGIGAAPADVAAHELADLIGAAGLALGNQARGGTNLAGGAVAALERSVLDEGLLQRMQRASLRQTLDGRDLRAVLHYHQGEARIYPAASDQNRAGPALAVIAALLRAGEIEMEPKRIEEGGPRCDQQAMFD